ncbi:MAG: RluA family pseudouridine synthase [Candidatus Magasanikbacteria bacterium]|nr:RluA family pseudouridine synthase [Candidatus Magasanikbacteria bacterium]
MPLKVLYEDNHLIAVFKPAGVLVQGDKTGDLCLMDEVKKYLKEKYAKTGNVFLGLIHRLDRPVSGIVLFAKTSKGASRLSEQIRNHDFKKEYQALVEGVPKNKKDTQINYLLHDEKTNKAKIYDAKQEGAQLAELSYEVIENRGKNSLLKIDLKTGRHHQIRAQLAHIGHPIVGDIKYGAKAPLPDQSIALCAISIMFKAATGGEEKVVSTKAPF